jgi:hypothetical protein
MATSYGTTLGRSLYSGTIIKITSSGALTTLCSFSAYADGSVPYAALFQATIAKTHDPEAKEFDRRQKGRTEG